jgi:polyadenylate-binding protein
MFKPFGEIVSCKLETYHDGKSRGYAYVQFRNEEDAENALQSMNDREVKGKKLEVNVHEKKDHRKPQVVKFNNLFVKNLPRGADDNALKTLFAEFGEIESVQV